MGINFSSAGTANAEPTEAKVVSTAEATEPAAVATKEAAPVEVAAPPARTIMEADLSAAVGGCEGAPSGQLATCLGKELESRGYGLRGAGEALAEAEAVKVAGPAASDMEPVKATATEATSGLEPEAMAGSKATA